ncbi:MOSC domain-containing protein [Cupriavidus respiraculi]|nr:MOSC domain-containing protein [Cupriavidus respiraculi]
MRDQQVAEREAEREAEQEAERERHGRASPAIATGRVLAVSIGKPVPLVVAAAGREAVVQSGIRKHPVSTLAHPLWVQVRPSGVSGDEQADRSVHGGPLKAVYAYPLEHYAGWNQRRREVGLPDAGRPLSFGAMGENLTLEGLLERDLWVGDRLVIGRVTLRVESPRKPCHKFNAVMGYPQAVRDMVRTGHSGVYLSVVRPGEIRAGDTVVLEPGPREVSIDSLNQRQRDKRLG